MKERVFFALFTVLLIFNFPSISMAQALRPDLMFCGNSDRTGADLYLGTGPFNEISGCVPDSDTQALLIALDGTTITGNGAAWLAYLNAGGVIISSAYQTNEIYNEMYGTSYIDTISYGVCKNNAMPSLKLNPTDPFWLDNAGLTESPADSSCGSDNVAMVDGETEVTALGGLVDTAIISFAVRYQGSGVFWLLEADWPRNTHAVTEDSKYFMGVLISNGADLPELVFEDGFEGEE